MRFSPFRSQAQVEPLIQPGPMVADMAVIRTVVGFAPAPPALLQTTGAIPDHTVDGTDPAAMILPPFAGGAPTQLAPVHLPVEIFDADELLG